MDVEVLLPLIAAVISMLAGSLGISEEIRKLVHKILGRTIDSPKTYSERLSELTENLAQSTKQVDAVLAELAHVAQEREATVQALEKNLSHLEGREKDMQERISALQQVSIPAVEHFAKLLETGEKRSAWRDYKLFGAGVIVSTAIAIGLKFTGLG